jgi:circadian clock protein KaiB
MARYLLRLFIAGTLNSQRLISNLRCLCNELGDEYVMIIIDILEEPDLAETEKIIATPTLIAQDSNSIKRFVGDLSDTEKILSSFISTESRWVH